GEKTSEETMQILVEFVKSIGKVPVRVEKDVPGFIANRVAAPRALLIKAILDKNIATPEEVDATLLKAGFPMGPFELMDYVGIDVHYNALKYYEKTLSPEYKPAKLIEDMVKEGKLGAKTGKGWYDWSAGRPKIDLSKATNKIDPLDFHIVEINEAVKLVEMGVAKPEDIDTAMKLGFNRDRGPFEILKGLEIEEVVKRLKKLSKEYGFRSFEPAEMLRSKKILEILKGK
ncbi:MAG: 3-hydroxyacyl-CoA dehydrogenase family protein, partial [Archaeoglobaceae archaeon]